MTAVKQVTTWPTEMDFEADLQAALRRAFPWLPPGSIRHQTKFSFNCGRALIEVNGKQQSTVTGRADVLLYWGKQPLAVLELKRPSQAIEESDMAQGLSYARMLHPAPPLVAVTNGSELILLETHTGKEWKPSEASEGEFANLIKQAAHAAGNDLKQAISTLMGINASIWVQAIRQTSSIVIEGLSGGWDEQLLPFVADFLVPRGATTRILELLQQGQRLVLLEGPPLSGKSNVLRELTVQTAQRTDMAVLYVEADSGSDMLRAISDALSNALSWPISREEARAWLLRLSKTPGASLVIAVDDLGTGREDIRAEVEDLTSHVFGNHLRIVLSLDESVAERLVMNSTGRKASAIGRRATRVPLGILDNTEFEAATRALWERRIGIMHGGESSPELRLPWVLRAATSHIVSDEQYENTNLAAVLPPLLALDLIQHTRERFTDNELRRKFQAAAKAVLKDAEDRTRPIGLILRSMATYVVRRNTLREFLEHNEIEFLTGQGYLRLMMHDSGEPIIVVTVPELLASEAAHILGMELLIRVNSDAKAAAEWLVKTATGIPLGDILAAQAVLDAALYQGSLPLDLLSALINSRPEPRPMAPGTRAAIYLPSIGVMDMTIEKDGVIAVQAHGRRVNIQEGGSEPPVAYANVHAWLILSHLAGCPWGIERDGHVEARVDPAILTEVATCPIVLRAVGPDPEMSAVATHRTPHGEVVCHKAGIVEPITLSILRYLGGLGAETEDWLEEAVERKSFPLLMRLYIALEDLSGTADKEVAAFAKHALKNLIEPALSKFPQLH
ncbi:MAG TPA: hypothetical protein VFK06_17955 [Candidatus Angelobacter sp.]|nr:hypothetical protein [Candidatus Angelobacter sp.]